jgi:O-antigen/teichoic acid export membrane protein
MRKASSLQREACELTNERVLIRSSFWNVIGQGAPLAVAVVAIPPLIRTLGVERYGILTIAWLVIGYFNLFDIGLGRALTKIVADSAGKGDEQQRLAGVIWISLLLIAVLGMLAAALLVAVTPLLVRHVLKLPASLRAEAVLVFYLLAAVLPLVTSTSALRGILEAQQRFATINAIRIPQAALTFLVPLAMATLTRDLVPITAALVATRAIAFVAHLVLCLRLIPKITGRLSLHLSLVRPALQLGSWMTVSNIVSPVLVYADRMLISTVLSVTAVAYYATPQDVLLRLTILPGAISGVLFPAFTVAYSQNRPRAVLLLTRSVAGIFLIVFPILLSIVAFAPEALAAWVGPEFASNSGPVVRWLAVGVFLNCLAQIPFSFVQAAGRPDLTAKLHLAELPAYLGVLVLLLRWRGIEGAAMAWALRTSVDAVLLFLCSRQLLGSFGSLRLRLIGGSCAVVLLLMALVALPRNLGARAMVTSGALLVFALSGWFILALHQERSLGLSFRSLRSESN